VVSPKNQVDPSADTETRSAPSRPAGWSTPKTKSIHQRILKLLDGLVFMVLEWAPKTKSIHQRILKLLSFYEWVNASGNPKNQVDPSADTETRQRGGRGYEQSAPQKPSRSISGY